MKVFILRESAYANYADCCFPCRTDYANTLLLSSCLRGLRGIAGLLTILCSTNLFLLTKHRRLRETTPQLRPAGKRLREHACSFTSVIAPYIPKKKAAQVVLGLPQFDCKLFFKWSSGISAHYACGFWFTVLLGCNQGT